VADTAPPALRGTAYGYFNLLTGVTMLIASIMAGALWDAYGPVSTFLASFALALLTLAGLMSIGDVISRPANE